MICSTPVISTDCISGPREILAPNTDINFQLQENIEFAKNGILYPVDDEKSLANAITILMTNEEKQQEYIENSLLKSREFSLEKIIGKYKEVLNLKT